MDQGTADDHTYAGIAALIPYFHAAGWVAGAGWTIAQNQDAEHFEVSQETLQLWSIQGLLSPSPPVTPSNDFNHDGFSDVLWRNNSTGAWGYSDIHGNTGNGLGDTSTSFKVAGVGDFNHDGFSDVLWRNGTKGDWGYSDIHGNAWHGLGTFTTRRSFDVFE